MQCWADFDNCCIFHFLVTKIYASFYIPHTQVRHLELLTEQCSCVTVVIEFY